ncbi:MAG: serine/threonine protein phosphatase [Planctomycetales bacterium]|nr:serine/threonine protein phosphatase [Planctomycetales bacterium]
MARTIAIGDIHGCADALRTILTHLNPRPDDTIITLGDYVDRGPASREVVEMLLELRSACRLIPLIGNHEAMLLRARDDAEQMDFWMYCGGRQTLESYGGMGGVPDSHWEFFESCRRYYEDDERFYVHANYDPMTPLEHTPDNVLLWTHLTTYVPRPHRNGKQAIVGHTAQVSGQLADWGHVLCLDTWCFGSGCLTACEFPQRRLCQSNRSGQLICADLKD